VIASRPDGTSKQPRFALHSWRFSHCLAAILRITQFHEFQVMRNRKLLIDRGEGTKSRHVSAYLPAHKDPIGILKMAVEDWLAGKGSITQIHFRAAFSALRRIAGYDQ